MTTNITSLGSTDLIARAQAGDASARAELLRRHNNRVAKGKRPVAKVAKFLGLAPETETEAPKAASPAPAPAPEPTGERMFSDLSGLERHRALKAEAERLGLDASGKSNAIEARIRAAQASAPEPAPEGDDLDVAAVVAGVQRLADEHLALRAEVARLKAQASKPGASGDWLKSVASALRQTGHMEA